MGIERERKYLVISDEWRTQCDAGVRIAQGYIARSPIHHVRVRVMGNDSFLTIKSRQVDRSRLELEYPIPIEDGHQLLGQLDSAELIDKIRYPVRWGHYVIEVDEFGGANQGLVLAEIELTGQDRNWPATLPDWLGTEVTDDSRYNNSQLAIAPFCQWHAEDEVSR